jgi:hypothetical protein
MTSPSLWLILSQCRMDTLTCTYHPPVLKIYTELEFANYFLSLTHPKARISCFIVLFKFGWRHFLEAQAAEQELPKKAKEPCASALP